jgi:hypothetical protein
MGVLILVALSSGIALRVACSLTGRGRGRELTALLLPLMERIVASAPGIVSPVTT